jgi:hypothetical protein
MDDVGNVARSTARADQHIAAQPSTTRHAKAIKQLVVPSLANTQGSSRSQNRPGGHLGGKN